MPHGRARVLRALVVALALAVPATAAADDDDRGDDDRDDVRVTATCTRSSDAELRLREDDDDRLRLDFDLRARPRGGRWLVVVVHERRLVFHGRLRTSRSSGRISLRRSLPDFFGEDTVRLRASGPRGATCRASVTVADT
jgi:hypothetical protein